MSRVEIRFDGDARGAKAAGDQARASINSVGRAAREQTGAVEKLGDAIRHKLGRSVELAAKTGGAGLLGLAASVAYTGFKFDDLRQRSEIAFTTMLGSGQKAKAFLDDLQKFANDTPFEFADLTRASQRMMAMGFQAKEVLPTLTAVGDAVAAMGGGSEQIDQVTRALGQMMAKGKVTSEELMQLNEAGLNGLEMIARKMGISTAEAQKQITAGTISARAGIAAIVEGGDRDFGGMMKKQSGSFSGLLSTLKDTFTQVSGQVMKPFFDDATKGMKWLVDFTQKPEFTAGVRRFADVLETKVHAAARAVWQFFHDHWGDIKAAISGAWEATKAGWAILQKAAGYADDLATAVGGWKTALELVAGVVMLRKLAGLATAIGGKGGLSGAAFSATSAIAGRMGLLAALNAIPAAVVTDIIVRRTVTEITGSESAGNISGTAAAGAALGGMWGRVLGAAAKGAKVGGVTGAGVSFFANPDTPGGGTVPVWDGSRWAGVSDAGQAYWTDARRKAGLGAPAVGLRPYDKAAVTSTSSSSTQTVPRQQTKTQDPIDYSSLFGADTTGSGSGDGGGTTTKPAKRARVVIVKPKAAQTVDVSDYLARQAYVKRQDDLLGATQTATSAANARLRERFTTAARARAGAEGNLDQLEERIALLPESLRPKVASGMAKIRAELSTVTSAAEVAKITPQMTKVATLIDKALTALKTRVTKRRAEVADALAQVSSTALDAMDAQTRKLVAAASVSLFGTTLGSGDLTPAEKALRDRQAARESDLAARSEKELRDNLATAQHGGTQAEVAAAQRSLDDFLFDQQTKTMEREAAAQRTEADNALQAEQDRIQAERAVIRQRFAGRLEEIQTAFANEEITAGEAQKRIATALADPAYQTDFANVGTTLGTALGEAFTSALSGMEESIRRLVAAVNGVRVVTGQAPVDVPSAVTGGTPMFRFKAGGRVPGRYVGVDDTVAARLTPGETVIDRRLTQALEQFFIGGGGNLGDRIIVRGDVFVDGARAGRLLEPRVTAAQGRSISYPSTTF